MVAVVRDGAKNRVKRPKLEAGGLFAGEFESAEIADMYKQVHTYVGCFGKRFFDGANNIVTALRRDDKAAVAKNERPKLFKVHHDNVLADWMMTRGVLT